MPNSTKRRRLLSHPIATLATPGHKVRADPIVIGGGDEDTSVKAVTTGQGPRGSGHMMKYSDTHSPFSAPKTLITAAQIRVWQGFMCEPHLHHPSPANKSFSPHSMIQTNLNLAAAHFLSGMDIHFHSIPLNSILLKMCLHQVFSIFLSHWRKIGGGRIINKTQTLPSYSVFTLQIQEL